MRIASSRDGKALAGDPIIIPTPQRFDDGIVRFTEIVRTLLDGEKCDAAAGGIAGPFDEEKKYLVRAPHIPDWANKPIAQKFSEALGGAQVYFENDAALAALAEAQRGAGKDHKIVAYITIGTGVGGARVVAGRIDQNAHGFEPGHQIIEGSHTRLENFIGGKAIEARFHRLPSEISDENVWDEVAEKLSFGLVNTMLHWSPHIVVLGGAISRKIPIDKVQNSVQELLTIFAGVPPIVLSQFGDTSGLEGARMILPT